MELAPDDSSAYQGLAVAYRRSNEGEQAYQTYLKALERSEPDSDASS